MTRMQRDRGSRYFGPRLACAAALLAALAGQAVAEPCSPADLNEDGMIDFADYLEFLNRYDAGDLSVDYTGDGLVDFSDYLEFLNLYELGCPSTSPILAPLATNPLAAYPFAEYVQTYNDGAAVSITADPAKLSSLTGKTTDVYITTNRTWAVGDALTDVRGGPQSISWPGGSVAAGTFALTGSSTLPFDAGESIGIGYDLVVDADNSGTFTGGDVVDGGGAEAGFYKIRDLTTANAGTPVTTVPIVSIPVGRTTAGFEPSRWYYPTDIATRGQIPLIMIAHGNGHQYSWYDFLGQHLASYGYIVISHRNNTSPGDGVPEASTTLLDHTNTAIALQASLQGGVLNGHINQNEIYWIGHSRGGECVAYGWDRLNRGLYTPTGGFARVINPSDIKYIQYIAPVDFAGAGVAVGGGVAFTDPGPVDNMLLYGSADGDVCGCPGNPIAWSFDVLERGDERRNSVYIQGADHNDFNCCGFDDFDGPAGTAVGRPAAQAIQKALTLASIKYYRTGNVPGGEVMWRQYESFKPGATLATANVDYEFKDFGAGRKFVIDDFQTNPATGTSSSGGMVTFTVTNLTEGQMRDNNSTYTWLASDPFNGMSRGRTADQTRGIVFDYDGTLVDPNLTFDIVAAGRDTTPYSYLSFRACQGTQHPFTRGVLADQVFEVELEDGAGNTSRIRIDAYGGGIEEVYQRISSTVPGWQNEFETIKIRLGDFCADGRTLDLTDVAKVRFIFGNGHGTIIGRLGMDDVEFVK